MIPADTPDEPRAHPTARSRVASGARRRRPRRREKSAVSRLRAPRCWPAGSVTSCSPTTTGAVSCGESLAGAALHRRLGSASNDAVLRCPRCHAHFDVVHAGACVDGNGRHAPTPISSRYRCWNVTECLSMAVAEAVALMTGAVRRSRRASAPPGRIRSPPASAARCARRPIADEHQHVVNVEGRQLMCVCRGCYLLFTDTERRSCAFAPSPTAIWSSRISRWTAGTGRPSRYRSGWRSSSAIRRWTGRSRSIPGRRAPPNPSWTSTAWNDIRAADPRVDMLADDTEAVLVRVPDDEDRDAAELSAAHRRLLRVRRPVANAVARLRRRSAGARIHRRILRASSTAAARWWPR